MIKLNNLNLKIIAENLIDTFLNAGKIAREISQQGIKVIIKADKSPVTDADLAVDKILKNKIRDFDSNIPIVSEETVNFNIKNRDKTFWLIDPIDGTKDYIKQRDEYTLNAALVINFYPTIGIIYAPAKERLFYSYGKGLAFELNKEKKIVLNCKKRNNNEIIGLENSGNTPPEIKEIYIKSKVSKLMKISSSLKFCILASGEADIYAAKARACEWDIAAGHIILEHAGGSVTDHDGKTFLYGKEKFKNIAIIAKRSSNLEK